MKKYLIPILIIYFSFFYCESVQKKEKNSGFINRLGKAIDGGEVIPLKLRRAYIYNVRNRSFESNISSDLTHKIQLELNREGRLVAVDRPERARIHIYVSLNMFKRIPLSWDTIGRPLSYEMIAGCVVKVRKKTKSNGSVLLIDPTRVEARVMYNTGAVNLASEFQAKRDLLDQLAQRIVRVVETGWYTDLKSDRELGKPREEVDEKLLREKAREEKKISTEKSEQDEISEMEEKSFGEKNKNTAVRKPSLKDDNK